MKRSTRFHISMFLIVGSVTTYLMYAYIEADIGKEQAAEGMPVLIVAMVALLLALYRYTSKNRYDVEKLAVERDYGAIRRLIFGTRKRRPAED